MSFTSVLESASLLFVLVNPFLLSIYLLDLIRRLEAGVFRQVLVRGSAIATAVFLVFAWMGERIFTDVLHVRFSSFLVFGGLIFLVVAFRFVFQGPEGLEAVRGEPGHLAGSIAMPFLIGPGTVSASMMIGARTPGIPGAAAILAAMSAAVASLVAFKALHDWVSARREELVERYVEIVGRVMSLLIGTIAVEMILLGLERWIADAGL